MTMAIKAHDTFWQRRNLRGMQPKLLEVLEEFLNALAILNDSALDYPQRKRRILYLMRNYHYTDDEPWCLDKKRLTFTSGAYNQGRLALQIPLPLGFRELFDGVAEHGAPRGLTILERRGAEGVFFRIVTVFFLYTIRIFLNLTNVCRNPSSHEEYGLSVWNHHAESGRR